MLIVIPCVFLFALVPAYCIGVLADRDIDPSIHALALLILSPYAFLLIRILRTAP